MQIVMQVDKRVGMHVSQRFHAFILHAWLYLCTGPGLCVRACTVSVLSRIDFM